RSRRRPSPELSPRGGVGRACRRPAALPFVLLRRAVEYGVYIGVPAVAGTPGPGRAPQPGRPGQGRVMNHGRGPEDRLATRSRAHPRAQPTGTESARAGAAFRTSY